MQLPSPDPGCVDNPRISVLRDRLAADRYVVNPRRIARKIIDLEVAIGKACGFATHPVQHA